MVKFESKKPRQSPLIKLIILYAIGIACLGVHFWSLQFDLHETASKVEEIRSDWSFAWVVIYGIIRYLSLIAGVLLVGGLTIGLIYQRTKKEVTKL